MKLIKVKDIDIKIGSNVNENDQLFDEADDSDTWFHINGLPSAHMWIKDTITDKNILYQIALQLKKTSKYKKMNNVPIVYTTKSNLTKTDKIGTLIISGKSKIIKV